MCVYVHARETVAMPKKEIYHYMHNGSEAREHKKAILNDEEKV
jgi:hypothetical protein